MLISPGYQYESVEQRHLPDPQDIEEKFKRVLEISKKYRLHSTPMFLEFAAGMRDYNCSPWSTVTFTPLGWKGPCYLIGKTHTFDWDEFWNETDWDYWESRQDTLCQNCAMHSGFEASVVTELRSSPRTWPEWLRGTSSGRAPHRGSPRSAAVSSHDGRGRQGCRSSNGSAGCRRLLLAQPLHRAMEGRTSSVKVFLTGATGFVGGHLLRELLGRGARVRCLARDPARFREPPPGEVDVVAGDLRDPASLAGTLAGVKSLSLRRRLPALRRRSTRALREQRRGYAQHPGGGSSEPASPGSSTRARSERSA